MLSVFHGFWTGGVLAGKNSVPARSQQIIIWYDSGFVLSPPLIGWVTLSWVTWLSQPSVSSFVIMSPRRKNDVPCLLSSSSDPCKKRQVSRRKTNRSLFTCVPHNAGEIPRGKRVTLCRRSELWLQYHLQLQMKERCAETGYREVIRKCVINTDKAVRRV